MLGIRVARIRCWYEGGSYHRVWCLFRTSTIMKFRFEKGGLPPSCQLRWGLSSWGRHYGAETGAFCVTDGDCVKDENNGMGTVDF